MGQKPTKQRYKSVINTQTRQSYCSELANVANGSFLQQKEKKT